MERIRIIEIPPLKVVNSGNLSSMEVFEAFDRWWSSIDVKIYITPRDFMWYNDKKGYWEWFFALPEGHQDSGGYEVVDFPGGLYAVATSKDADEAALNETKAALFSWIETSGCFALSTSENDSAERYVMAHVITPKVFKEKMGYHLSDIFVPIVVK
ncbi:GyrI-like domain-containing protein [Gorillibacterium sp. sgz5001074]|uniref:GyrI-like domain-containing protein n=1 Tax=Gorillibacterium sp. sgz5001074 TaxID=3446695 RepID=UPI003F661AB1